ncbi:ornithine carbamoyltransferase [Polyrhizophydium stewartii]|uniref:ornithine carbamoyltransferase n=1 Tax=Polyrhizophydium stewartii TaxID=2732419 RepID=A0ABR4N9F9_9FUNG
MRHLVTLRDYATSDITALVRRSLELKRIVLSGVPRREAAAAHALPSFEGRTLGMVFSKRSTRTRVSSESGWAFYGGHPMFLGKDDIQLGVNESVRDTAQVVGSMVDMLLARVGPHQHIEEFARHSRVPVINALSDRYHPLQILADLMTLYETFAPEASAKIAVGDAAAREVPMPSLSGLRVAWVGDANNILNSMLVTYPRLGIDLSVACPRGYQIDESAWRFAQDHSRGVGAARGTTYGQVQRSSDPREAVSGADVIVTDTWISMGQEHEKVQRMHDFAGFQVTESLAREGGAKPGWKFMHCLPRKAEEVSDEVFYNPERSVVFQEAENRKYAVMSVFEFLMRHSTKSRSA